MEVARTDQSSEILRERLERGADEISFKVVKRIGSNRNGQKQRNKGERDSLHRFLRGYG